MSQILVLNGPNLNLLGKREPEHYGHTSLDQIQQQIERLAKDKGHDLQFVQSNAEHELVDHVQQAMNSGVAFTYQRRPARCPGRQQHPVY